MDDQGKTLKPCPFCGGVAAFGQVPDNEFDPNSGGHFIQCTNQRCEASSALVFAAMDDPYRELAERWNRREDAFKAGREAGMREASEICKKRADWILTRQDGKPEELSNVILRHHASAHVSAQEEILSAIDK